MKEGVRPKRRTCRLSVQKKCGALRKGSLSLSCLSGFIWGFLKLFAKWPQLSASPKHEKGTTLPLDLSSWLSAGETAARSTPAQRLSGEEWTRPPVLFNTRSLL